ncbi:MAG: 1-deoxy-D-xylulose-5-phosphate reductoisomerase [Janthinobacterium lividum]
MKRIVILGSTGSIGTQTLDTVRRLPDHLRVVGLSAYRNETLLREQAAHFDVPSSHLELGDEADLVRLATLPDADVVVVSVAGAVGTAATIAALEAGKDVALATKEVLVAAGEIVTAAARKSGARILPIDSEHSAIFQCLQGQKPEYVRKLWLTASGGPFREWSSERIAAATVSDALNHPTWPSMGRKITIDSATLMNKALEMIEARWLFDVPIDRVGVVVHPQSVVHSLVELVDGSFLAQLGLPDMRVPIEYALLYPDRADMGIDRFDLLAQTTSLTFEAPDESRFPSLGLARRAAEAGGTLPAVMNGANEAAVALFLDGRIPFRMIIMLVARVMDDYDAQESPTLAQITAADRWARNIAEHFI